MINDYLAYLRTERGASEHTVRAYLNDLASAPVTGATFKGLQLHINSLSCSARSKRRKVSVLRSFFKWAVRHGKLASSPADMLESPKVGARLPKCLDADDIIEAIETAHGRDCAILECLFGAGLRVSELVGLNVGDIKDGMVTTIGKGNKQRVVPIGQKAQVAVDALSCGRAPKEPVFTNAHGQRLSTNGIRSIVRRYISATPHQFRHSFATAMLNGGTDIRLVQEMLGHASLSTTQIYTRVTTKAIQQAHKRAHPRA